MTNKAFIKKIKEIRKTYRGDELIQKLKGVAEEIAAAKWTHYQSGTTEKEEKEILDNIHYALQTQSMMDMCKIASRNFWIALIATVAAVISAIAAWIAVVRN